MIDPNLASPCGFECRSKSNIQISALIQSEFTVVACNALQLRRQQTLRSFFNIRAFVATTHIHISDTYLFSIFDAEHHPYPGSLSATVT